MSDDTLRQINDSIKATTKVYGSKFRAIEHIDTTGTDPQATAVRVAEKTLAALNNFLDEEICVVPADLISNGIPQKGLVKDPAIVSGFVDLVNTHKHFMRRSEAEANPRVIQPIPCALIRWQDQILLLQRTKKGHALHNRFLLWAGGHVNRGDDDENILAGPSC